MPPGRRQRETVPGHEVAVARRRLDAVAGDEVESVGSDSDDSSGQLQIQKSKLRGICITVRAIRCVLICESFLRPDGGDDSLPAGPSDIDELHLWAEHVTNRCIKQGMGMSSCRNLTLYVTAKWAGLGGMAVGLLYAKEAWETSSDAASDSTLDIRLFSFSEKRHGLPRRLRL